MNSTEIQTALQQAADPAFWGEVVIKYKEGRPQFVSVTRTTSIERQQGRIPCQPIQPLTRLTHLL